MGEKRPLDQPLSVDTSLLSPVGLHDLQGHFSDATVIGHGVTGLVYAATDVRTKTRVAIKKLFFGSQRRCQSGLREIRFLRQMQHENIVSLRDILDPGGSPVKNEPSLDCAYLVQELLDTDLSRIIQSKQLTGEHSRLICYQILRGLKYIHSANVIHRDLKPSNIMLNCDTLLVKIGDYGLARVLDPSYNHQGQLTENVGSCWYKAPEVILMPGKYNRAVDLWAVGCILAEMLLGQLLFCEPNEMSQVLKMIDTLHLSEVDWTLILGVMPNKLLKNQPLRPRQPLSSSLAHLDVSTFSFVEKLLTFDPECRPSATEALGDVYLSEYHLSDDEPCALRPFHIEHEVDDLPITTLKEMIIQESCRDPASCGEIQPQEQVIEERVEPKTTKALEPKELTHTLDQILQISAGNLDSDLGDLSEFEDPEDNVATKNLLNSFQSPRQHSPNIFDEQMTIERRKSQEKCDDDEKDVVEMSEEKIAEDLALKKVDNTKIEKSSGKEEGHDDSNRVRSRRHSGNKKSTKKENDSAHKQRLASSRKLIMDKIESEKEWRRQQQRDHHNELTDEELDELYRLPTDHLRHDKDYSNQRIQEKLRTNHPNDSTVDLYEGACGGGGEFYDDDDLITSDDEIQLELSTHNAVILEVRRRNTQLPLEVHRPPVTPQRQEVCSSPEVPSSPRMQNGARPKKSPKKQRAL